MFEHTIELALSGLHWEICLIYIDDVVVLRGTFEEHIERLHQVLKHIKEASLKLWPVKWKLFRHEVVYLGQVVSQDGMKTDPKKIMAITEWPTPSNAKEGALWDFALITATLTEVSQIWPIFIRSRHMRSFTRAKSVRKNSKRVLTTPPVLAYPADDRIFFLDSDASGQGLRAVFYQLHQAHSRKCKEEILVAGYQERCDPLV